MQTPSFQTILCPVDFSPLSANGLRQAIAFAQGGATRVIAVYADRFEPPPYFTEGRVQELRRQHREYIGEAERSLRAFVAETLGEASNLVETRVVEGFPADAIVETAVVTGASLIVMGTHGRTGMNRWMLGSVAERVLRESPVPVLTVREAPRLPIRHIVCPVTDSDVSRRALQVASGLAQRWDAVLTVLHVVEPGSPEPARDLCDWSDPETRARCSIREVVRHGDAAEEIVAMASASPCELLVIGSAPRRFFEGMILGSTTLRTVRHSPCPVLTVGQPGDSEVGRVTSELAGSGEDVAARPAG
jgi:nucleotide-binding universal stress UspA family protein